MTRKPAGEIPAFTPPSWPGVMSEVEASILEALRNGEWGKYEGEYVERLGAKLCERFAQPLVTLCSSGTIAVELALRGIGVEAGSEVILGGYDFPGNFRAIEAVSAMPVLVDLAADRFVISLEWLEAAVSDKTAAVIVSHLHGCIAPIGEIMAWARSRGIAVVEDACQCPGATLAGRPAGSFGDVSVLSFGGSKLLTAGRGGAVLTGDERIHQRMKIAQDRGNLAYPLSQLQAAAVLPQLETLEGYHARRRRAAELLRNGLQKHAELSLPKPEENSSPAYYKFPLTMTTQSRDAVCEAAQSVGIPLFPGFRGFVARSSRRSRAVGELTNSKRYAAQTALLHHSALLMEESEIVRMAEVLESIVRT